MELRQVGFPHRTGGGGRLEEFHVVLNAGIDIVQAELETAATFFEKIQRHVHRDRMDPSVKGRLPPEAADRLVSLRKNVLQQVVRVLMVRGHVVNQTVETRRVFYEQLIEGGR